MGEPHKQAVEPNRLQITVPQGLSPAWVLPGYVRLERCFSSVSPSDRKDNLERFEIYW